MAKTNSTRGLASAHQQTLRAMLLVVDAPKMAAPTIIAVRAQDGRWSYLPETYRALLRPEHSDEGEFDTGEEAIAAAKRDRTIPADATFKIEV